MAYIEWWNRTGPITLGERFGLNEISTRAKTLSPTKSHMASSDWYYKPPKGSNPDWIYYPRNDPKAHQQILEDFDISEETMHKDGGRIDMKPGGLVEPGVSQLVQPNLDGSRPGYGGLPLTEQFPKLEVRAIELLNQGLPMDEVSNTLEAEGVIKIKTQPRAGHPGVMKKNYSGFNRFYKNLLKDKKLNITEIATKISGVPFSKEVWLQRENAVIEAFKKNPTLSAQQISKLVSTELGQHVSYTAVANALRRANIDYQGRDQKLLPDIKKLDKIIKNNIAFLSTKGSPKDKVKFLFEEFKKVTKNKNLDMDKFSYRLERVGNLYAGTGVDRTVEKIYKSIKAPKNYLESGLHRNMVGMLDQFTKGIVGKAQLLGLPQKDIDLLSDVTKGAKSLSKISMAGDHTDIDGLMKNFSNYRKNFMRINMISNQLNIFKSASDKAIIKLYDEAVALQKSNHPNVAVRRKEILEKVTAIRENFKTKTGLNIGGFEFDAKGNPIMKKFETQRLGDLKNPRNKAILNAMNNLVKQSGIEFKGIDQELRFANTIKERFNILKNASVAQLQNSKYIKAFAEMSGEIGKAANTILKTKSGKIGAGVGIYGLLSSIASASEKEELETGDKKREASVLPSVISEHPILSSAAAVTAAAPKKVWEGVKWAGKKLTPIMTPGVSTLIHGGPQNLDPTSGQDLSTAAFWKHATDWMGARSRWGNKMIGLKKRLRDIALRGGLPTRFLPIISGGASVAMGPMLIKDAAEWLQSRIDKEGLTGKIEEQSFIGDEAGAGYLMEEAYDKKRKEDAEGMDYAQGGIASLIK